MNLLEKEINDEGFLLSLIPQRKPFVMVDKVLYYSESKVISGFSVPSSNLLTINNKFSEPGLIENMAQTIALHTGYKFYLNQQPAPKGYIGVIKNASIFELPLSSQELVTTAEILHDILGVTLVQAKVECNGQLLAQSEMKTVLAK